MPEPSDAEEHKAICERVTPKLAGAVDGSTKLTDREQRHAESCLQCQGELIRYRKLLRALHDLRTQVVTPAPGLLADILGNLGERAERRALRSMITGRRAGYAGGIAVAAAAGVTGIILLSGRNRNRNRAKKAA